MAEPLKGLRAIEFGQLLAGPFTGTLLGDFGADVIKVEPPGAGDAMRDWGRLRHKDHSLWWSILARNKRSVALNLREPEGQEIADRARRRPRTSCSRTSAPARWRSGASGPRTSTPATRGRSTPASPATARPAATRTAPGFASAGEAISGLRHINGYPDQAPPRAGISFGDTLAAQSAFQGILLALYRARTRRRGPGGRRGHRRRLLRDERVEHARVREDGLHPRADRAAAAAHRAEQRLPEQRQEVGRDRRQPRHAVAPAGGRSWASRSWGRTSASPPTTRAASTRTCSTRSSAPSPRGTPRQELDEIVNGGGVVCAPVYTAKDVYEDPYFRERELLVEMEDEVHGHVTVPGVVPEAEPDTRLDPSGRPLDGGRRHGRSAGGAGSGRDGAQAPRGRKA